MSAFTRPRPIKVVFLVEKTDYWLHMMQAIFANCYSRWGGRFNLIIPCENGAPRPSFLPWLSAYDPDVIYSYVELNETTKNLLRNDFDPSQLVIHKFYDDERTLRSCRPELPMVGLSSLSTCLSVSVSNRIEQNYKVRLIDKHLAHPEVPFLDNNFGTYSASSSRWPMSPNMLDFTETVTLVKPEILNSKQIHPRATGETVESEKSLYKTIAESRRIVGLSLLSAWDTPRIEIKERKYSDSFNLIIGNSYNDYLIFWNLRSYQQAWLDRDFSTLLVSHEDMKRPEIYELVLHILKFRNFVRDSINPQATVSIRSSSIAEKKLQEYNSKLKEDKIWLWREPNKIDDIDEIAATENALKNSENLVRNGLFLSDDWHEVSDLANEIKPQTVFPKHIRDFQLVRDEARSGMWAQDLCIYRKNDLSRFSNVKHYWLLTRRMQIRECFAPASYTPKTPGPIVVPRVNQSGILSLFTGVDGQLPPISHPDDKHVFETGICSKPLYFTNDSGHEKTSQAIAYACSSSDKGQYLKALLSRAGSLQEAEDIFLHKFWMERFKQSGATLSSTKVRIDEVKHTLKKKLKAGKIKSDHEWERLAKLVLREARAVRFVPRYIKFQELNKSYTEFQDHFWEEVGRGTPHDDVIHDEKKSFELSIQNLVSKRVLHQGIDWRCDNCANNNWVSINELKQKLSCEVCGDKQPAPVTIDWHFKLDGFILEGLREHGLLASIWCLKYLSENANSSFYFCESQNLFLTEKDYNSRQPSLEIDLLAVVDGLLYLCEVKSSVRKFNKDKFISDAEIIRPDIALFAVMDNVSEEIQRDFNSAKKHLASKSIDSKILSFNENSLENSPYLPSGRLFSFRYNF